MLRDLLDRHITSDIASFDDMVLSGQDIEAVNPAMVGRLRTQAASLDRYEIANQLADAVTLAAAAAHTRRWQEQLYGQASPDAIVDDEYHNELVAVWSLIAAENHIVFP